MLTSSLKRHSLARGRQFQNLALYVVLCVIWGSTWLVIKVGYGGLGPFNVAALRFFLAGAVLAPVVPLLGARWPRGAEWWLVVWVGLVLFAADYGLIYWAEQYLDSGLTASLFAMLPLITVGLAHLYVPGDRLTARKLAGTALAFFGVLALFGTNLRLDASKWGPMWAVVASTLCAAAAAVASKRHGAAIHAAALNAPAMLVGAVALSIASIAAGDGFRMPESAATWGAIGYLAIAGSVVTFLAYFSLLKTWSVTSLSFISVFTPVIALLLGFLLLDERPTALMVAGTALILSGVALAMSRPRLADSPRTVSPGAEGIAETAHR